MITPTVGRVVWFWPGKTDNDIVFHGQPLDAHITYVYNDFCVNIAGFDADGNPYKRTSVQLHQAEEDRPECYFCEWMTYQMGQAAKTEELAKIVDNGIRSPA